MYIVTSAVANDISPEGNPGLFWQERAWFRVFIFELFDLSADDY